MSVTDTVQFVLLGFLGGLAYALLKSEDWADLIKFSLARRLIVGTIVGYLYNILYSNYDFPNMIMCFVSGYAGVEFIEGLVHKSVQLVKYLRRALK